MSADHRDVLLAPVISEKSYGLLDSGKYTFLVRPDANKTQIRIAVEQVFGVRVTSVNTSNREGKRGRNVHGRVTTRHQGGGHKRAYRVIDFRRSDKDGVPAKVAHIEYDPNRTSRIALLHYADGEKRYILCPSRLEQGHT